MYRGTSARVIGYRVVLSAADKSDNKIIINPAKTSTVEFVNLDLERDYNIYVQAITSTGLGDTMNASVRIPAKGGVPYENKPRNGVPQDSKQATHITRGGMTSELDPLREAPRFPGAEILELPLGSSASSLFRYLTYYLLNCFLLFRLLM